MSPDPTESARLRLRESGGECDCGDYGLFEVQLRDGRVFTKAAIHGSGGLFRLARRSLKESGGPRDPNRLYAEVYRHLKFYQQGGYLLRVYLHHDYKDSDSLQLHASEIAGICFDDGEVRLEPKDLRVFLNIDDEEEL